MSAPPRLGALGALAALVFAPPALAGDDVPVELSFTTEKGEEGLVVKMYAKNTGKAVVKVDDNPSVYHAAVKAADGTVTELDVLPTMEMMSRAGPRRVWMPIQPGEKVMVGTATLMTADKHPVGGLELQVRVLTPEAAKVVTQTVQVGQPDA